VVELKIVGSPATNAATAQHLDELGASLALALFVLGDDVGRARSRHHLTVTSQIPAVDATRQMATGTGWARLSSRLMFVIVNKSTRVSDSDVKVMCVAHQLRYDTAPVWDKPLEVVVYSGAITTTERSSVRAALGTK
jgi:hypothetical protein